MFSLLRRVAERAAMRAQVFGSRPVGTAGNIILAAARAFRLTEKNLLQHDSIVVRFVARTVDERDDSCLCQRAEAVELRSVLLQLGPVAALELGPAPRIMTEPLPQLRARCDIFHPVVQGRLRLAYATGPEPIHENAHAVVVGSGFVSALQAKMSDGKGWPAHVTLSCTCAGVRTIDIRAIIRGERSRPSMRGDRRTAAVCE